MWNEYRSRCDRAVTGGLDYRFPKYLEALTPFVDKYVTNVIPRKA